MAKKKGFLESRGFKIFMKYLYGLGAAVVIAGALFKIMHWKGANEMLIAGMLTETVVFFVSAFEPLHEELDWAKVYPQLEEGNETAGEWLVENNGEEKTPEQLLAETEKGLKDVEITPELFESLSGSIKGLQDNVSKLSNIEDATVATNEYASRVREATHKMGQLNNNYDTTVDAMSSLASSVGGAARNAEAYQQQVSLVTQNLASLNAVYEVELSNAKQHLSSLNNFYGSMSKAMENMADASKDAEQYRSEVASLTRNLQQLNKVYGGMLSAMGGVNG